jgi:hypothetical protein
MCLYPVKTISELLTCKLYARNIHSASTTLAFEQTEGAMLEEFGYFANHNLEPPPVCLQAD